MDVGERWKSRLAKFNNSIYHSVFIEEDVKKEILLDILQVLFTILFLQQSI